jgi:hypothetical protein
MLRAARSPPMGSLVDRLGIPPVGSPRDLLLAMAPLPGEVSAKVEGWPAWLLPSELALTRSTARLREAPDPTEPPPS